MDKHKKIRATGQPAEYPRDNQNMEKSVHENLFSGFFHV